MKFIGQIYLSISDYILLYEILKLSLSFDKYELLINHKNVNNLPKTYFNKI